MNEPDRSVSSRIASRLFAMKKDDSTTFTALPKANRANVSRLGYIGRTPTEKPRDADSWFTPPEYVAAARKVMGSIDLDPFSSEKANEIVGAKHIFTIENSAFENSWNLGKSFRVFMNPPYSSGLCARAVERFIEQYKARSFVEGVVLVNNATDTRWFSALAAHCSSICFTDHRISFWNADRKNVSGNTRGQAFFYFGRKLTKFRTIFLKQGFVVIPSR